jgi:hypothetical protein
MDDLLYLGLTVAFFALSVALVYAFEKQGDRNERLYILSGCLRSRSSSI